MSNDPASDRGRIQDLRRQRGDAERELIDARNAPPNAVVACRALNDIAAERVGTSALRTEPAAAAKPAAPHVAGPSTSPRPRIDAFEYLRIVRTPAAIESWLAAIYATRAERLA